MTTPLGRLVKRVVEKVVGTYYEGADTPPRLLTLVQEFELAHPQATVRQWREFARQVIDTSYRAGWVRGYEWAERDEDRYTDLPPELAHAQEHVSDTPPVGRDLTNPFDDVEEEIEPAPLPPDLQPGRIAETLNETPERIDSVLELLNRNINARQKGRR